MNPALFLCFLSPCSLAVGKLSRFHANWGSVSVRTCLTVSAHCPQHVTHAAFRAHKYRYNHAHTARREYLTPRTCACLKQPMQLNHPLVAAPVDIRSMECSMELWKQACSMHGIHNHMQQGNRKQNQMPAKQQLMLMALANIRCDVHTSTQHNRSLPRNPLANTLRFLLYKQRRNVRD